MIVALGQLEPRVAHLDIMACACVPTYVHTYILQRLLILSYISMHAHLSLLYKLLGNALSFTSITCVLKPVGRRLSTKVDEPSLSLQLGVACPLQLADWLAD